MTEEKSKISEALKNFYEFFNPLNHSFESWKRYVPTSIILDREDKKFLKPLIEGIALKVDKNPVHCLRDPEEIAERYKDFDFDSSLEDELEDRMGRGLAEITDFFGSHSRGFLFQLIEEASGFRNESRSVDNSIEPLNKWIENYLSKIDFNKFRSFLVDFHDKSVLRKEIKNAQEETKKAQEIALELEKQKTELNATGEWEKHFEFRAEQIRTEIRKLRIRKKIRLVRTVLYLIPVIAVFLLSDYKSEWLLEGVNEKGKKELLLSPILVPFSAATLFLTSIVSYHLKHALRELNILKQMRASYLHRVITAKTFKELVASGHFKDAAGEVVVKEAAVAMFKKDSVGYLSKDQLEPSNTPVQEVVGIFKK